MKISIVVPHVPNTRAEELEKLKTALDKQTAQFHELLIISEAQSAASNNNIGWKAASGSIIWFLANDVIPQKRALQKALEVFQATSPDGVDGHMYGGVKRKYQWGFMTGHIFYTKAILKEIGGFDERFHGWRFDTDFAWSVLDRGGRVEYCPKSKVKHPEKGGTVRDMEAERLLREKHPERYAEAKEQGYLRCFL